MSIPWTPKPAQIDAVMHICAHPGAGVLAKPGKGKTSVSYAAFTVLKENGAIDHMLVVAPLRPCYKTWPAERDKWTDFGALSCRVIHGKTKVLGAFKKDVDVFVINYEGLSWFAANMPKGWLDRVMIVIDESTKCKNHRAKRTEILQEMCKLAPRKVILTGTPRPKHLEDLFSQIRLLDNGNRLEKFVTRFRMKYFDEDPQSTKSGKTYSLWIPKEGAYDAVLNKIDDICITLNYERGEMPELIENPIVVDLPASVRAAYEELEREFIVRTKGGDITAANAGVVGMKLRQIVGGGVYSEDDVVEFETNKLEALRDLIEEQAGEPLLVAVGFIHEVERIRAYLGSEFGELPYLGGGVSTANSNRIIDAWNAGEVPVLLAHPTSVAHGLNLQAGGSSVCWYSLTWNAEEFEQFNGRVWRQGQKADAVTVHCLVAERTIDERVLEVLHAKMAAQEKMFNRLGKSDDKAKR